ncbi:MAG: SANT/Myb domain-containing protein [Puniceicoccales bacterium]|jgi:hypothetical protein|nr:SANT/Myb domain-containing protein [Puniceicoccales bacterium]
MFKSKSFKMGKALLFVASGLLLSDVCFGAWTKKDDKALLKLVEKYKEDFKKVAKRFNKKCGKKKSCGQCRKHWKLLTRRTQKDGFVLQSSESESSDDKGSKSQKSEE